jgi:endonuclease/exonuclease/phosphatase family metal-dependent hydrolase
MEIRMSATKWIQISIISAAVLGATLLRAQEYVRDSEPKLLSYDELVQLSLDKPLSPELAERLQTITTTPFINNEAYYRGAKPRPLDAPRIGPSLRVVEWNIERGITLRDIQLFLTDKDAFMAKVKAERQEAKASGKRLHAIDLEKLPEEIEHLKAADVWILNEVDWGVKRSEYREVVKELAETLNMNWAYGVEFLEIDSKQLGTDTFEDKESDADRAKLLAEFSVDKDKVRALHGHAVLSRYPIRSARLVPFTVGYDWFKEGKIKNLEKAKRKAGVLVGEELLREMRRGGRTTLYVELDVPDAPEHRVTVVDTHLENRTRPKVRRQQMEEILTQVREKTNPVIIAGDWNTTGSDATPTSATQLMYKQFGNLDFWTTKGVVWTTGVGLVYSGTRFTMKLAGIQYRVDPTKANIPGLSPNLEHGLFKTLEKFRFDDGKSFDFRGEPARTISNKSGTLGDSNQRLGRGFVPTFTTEFIWKKVRVAKFRLDWILVKSELENPRDAKGPYIFAPHFPRTLGDLNSATPEPLSDHDPITVDLPFNAPPNLEVVKN